MDIPSSDGMLEVVKKLTRLENKYEWFEFNRFQYKLLEFILINLQIMA